MELTQARLKELLHYDPDSGELTWLRSNSNRGASGKRAGTRRKDGRWQARVNGRIYFIHRLAWLWMMGEWPPEEVDHRDCDKGNNRWANLRLASRTQNAANVRASRHNRLGIKGVRFQAGRYEAHTTVNGKQVYLGRFDTAEEASAAYFEAAVARHGEFARAA